MSISLPVIDYNGMGVKLTMPPAIMPLSANQLVVNAVGAHAAAAVAAAAAKDSQGNNQTNVLRAIYIGFSAAPAAGTTVIVQDGSTTVFEEFLGAANPPPIVFDPPKSITPGATLTVTVSDPGAGIGTTLYVDGWVHK
jgi:hypothetical protein